ncbi:MAG: 1-acyl-sn-glycerol-3-phosphate acyltransferase [Candidatus Coatesbacteria bacterium]|nr:1-acyl-sn-glycerol-3-phosphate acyltransferase [Candidatus Coatesbacteria bacterium]
MAAIIAGMHNRPLYSSLLFLAKVASALLLRLRVHGRVFVPRRGPLIVAPTHSSFLDPIVAGVLVRRRLTFMAKAFLFEPLFFGRLIRRLGAFPLRDDGRDVSSVRLALKLLKENRAVLIFPEGTRIRRDGLGRPHPGVAMIAARSGAPVLPIYIHDSHDALTELKYGRLPRVYAYAAPPLHVDKPGPGVDRAEYYARQSRRVMDEIARMRNWHLTTHGLPPEPPGVYVSDPKPLRPAPGGRWSIN